MFILESIASPVGPLNVDCVAGQLSPKESMVSVVQSAALVGTNLLLGWIAHAGAEVALLVVAGVLGCTGVLAAVHPALRVASAPRPVPR